MKEIKTYIQGREYDLSNRDDLAQLGTLISNCQKRHAPNDLALMANSLLIVIIELINAIDPERP